jgi:hypothetical protein
MQRKYANNREVRRKTGKEGRGEGERKLKERERGGRDERRRDRGRMED